MTLIFIFFIQSTNITKPSIDWIVIYRRLYIMAVETVCRVTCDICGNVETIDLAINLLNIQWSFPSPYLIFYYSYLLFIFFYFYVGLGKSNFIRGWIKRAMIPR